MDGTRLYIISYTYGVRGLIFIVQSLWGYVIYFPAAFYRQWCLLCAPSSFVLFRIKRVDLWRNDLFDFLRRWNRLNSSQLRRCCYYFWIIRYGKINVCINYGRKNVVPPCRHLIVTMWYNLRSRLAHFFVVYTRILGIV